jgi:hypothetical protein
LIYLVQRAAHHWRRRRSTKGVLARLDIRDSLFGHAEAEALLIKQACDAQSVELAI